MEIHELETALLLAEVEAQAKARKHSELKERKASLKEQSDQIAKAYNQEIWELRQKMEAEFQRMREECQAKTSGMLEEAASLTNPMWEARLEAQKAQAELESLQRQLDQAKRANIAAAEFATLENRWDLMTAGAPWREWAKDHQIGGAKKAVYEGRLILGDTMGLGKTLTSVIFCDMIRAATKDAAPDNPVDFGNMANYSK
jgi:predicted nuclease with TOPRIM domain